MEHLGSKTYPNESIYHSLTRYSRIGKVLLMARNRGVPAKRFPIERRVGTHICKTLTFLFHSIYWLEKDGMVETRVVIPNGDYMNCRYIAS